MPELNIQPPSDNSGCPRKITMEAGPLLPDSTMLRGYAAAVMARLSFRLSNISAVPEHPVLRSFIPTHSLLRPSTRPFRPKTSIRGRWFCGDRATTVVINNYSSSHPKRWHNPTHGEHTRKERTMLNAALGMLAMVPVAFGVAGYTMVSR
jgi:hypothetical protein